VSEFAFNGSAGIYSKPGHSQALGSLQTAVSAAATSAASYSQGEEESESANSPFGERQLELLLWLSNLELRLPPYGDLN